MADSAKITSAISGSQFIDPKGHGKFTARVGLNAGKGFTTE